MNDNANNRSSAGAMGILRAVIAGYLIYLGYMLIRDHLNGKSTLSPWLSWGFGAFFILAGAGFAWFTWKRYRCETEKDAEEDSTETMEETAGEDAADTAKKTTEEDAEERTKGAAEPTEETKEADTVKPAELMGESAEEISETAVNAGEEITETAASAAGLPDVTADIGERNT